MACALHPTAMICTRRKAGPGATGRAVGIDASDLRKNRGFLLSVANAYAVTPRVMISESSSREQGSRAKQPGSAASLGGPSIRLGLHLHSCRRRRSGTFGHSV